MQELTPPLSAERCAGAAFSLSWITHTLFLLPGKAHPCPRLSTERCAGAVSVWNSPTGRSAVGTAAPLRRGAGALGTTIAGEVPLLGAGTWAQHTPRALGTVTT